MPSVNLLAVLLSAIVGMVIGAVWFHPDVFGSTWMRLTGLNKKQLERAHKDGMGKSYLLCFISLLIMSYVLALFMKYLGVSFWMEGLFVAFLAWLGFVAVTHVNDVLWEGRPFELYALNTLHYLASLLIMGAVLGAWA